MLVTLYPPRVDGMVIAPLADDEMIARDQIYNPVPADASPLLTPYSHVVPLIVSVLTSISANAPNDTIAAAKIAARITSDSFIFYLLYFRTLILHGHPPQMRERRMARLTITERFREGRASARPFPYSGRDELLLVRSHVPPFRLADKRELVPPVPWFCPRPSQGFRPMAGRMHPPLSKIDILSLSRLNTAYYTTIHLHRGEVIENFRLRSTAISLLPPTNPHFPHLINIFPHPQRAHTPFCEKISAASHGIIDTEAQRKEVRGKR